MSLIVLKSYHNKKEIYLRPIFDSQEKQVGVKWVDEDFDIEIKNPNSK